MSTDPYQYFRIEAQDLVEKLTQGALDLEKGRGDRDLVSRLLRYAHTLKGAARVVKQTRISELSHAIEEILAPHREDSAAVPSAEITRILSLLDAVTGQLAALDSPPGGDQPVSRGEPPAEPLEHVRVDTAEMDALMRGIGDLRTHLSALEEQAAAIRQVSELTGGLIAEHRSPPGTAVHNRADERRMDGLEEIDRKLKAVHRTLGMSLDRAARELDQLDQRAADLRLIPAGSVFGAMERAVRDAAEELGKQVEFVVAGGETRLDAHGLSLLRGALIHLVRNAVAHGIESPKQRVAAGKPAAGRIELRVRRRGDHAVFTCSDDGRGIELDGVRQALVNRGRMAPAEARALGPDAALGMLLEGGITTAPRATEWSGRGIGLDVVRETVSNLKGTAIAHSEPRRGTTIELSVPVLIESVEVLHVEAGGQQVSIPLQAVRRAMRVQPADVARSGPSESIECDGQTLPLAALAGILQRENGSMGRDQPVTAIVLDCGSGAAAISVDRLQGKQRVVVRPLPKGMSSLAGVTGAFFDSEGDPQLVLDPAGLIQLARAGVGVLAAVEPAARPPLLVIDDSLTTRMLEQGILEAAGYEVDTAASGEEALRKARKRQYGLFLVDVEMPGLNGFEFLETTLADSRLRQVPSIMVTSRDSEEDRARGRRLGAKEYIVKSRFDEELLLQRIRELVG